VYCSEVSSSRLKRWINRLERRLEREKEQDPDLREEWKGNSAYGPRKTSLPPVSSQHPPFSGPRTHSTLQFSQIPPTIVPSKLRQSHSLVLWPLGLYVKKP
jgi:hypothetical protein